MRRVNSVTSRYPRKVTAPYVGGANTISSLGLLAGDPLVIPSGQTWTLDCKTPSLGSVTISGTLVADQTKDVAITAANIEVGAAGAFRIGSEAAPYTKKAEITLTGTESGRANRFVADRESTSGAGNGRLTRLFTSAGAVAETITVTFSSATTFTVSGSVSGALGAGTVGTLFNNRVRFIAVAGTTPWANGHTNTVAVVQLGFSNSGTPRSLQVQAGGKLILIGTPPAVKRTTVAAHISAAATQLTIAGATGWSRDDEIVIGPTDFYETSGGTSEKLFVRSKANTATLPLKGTVVNAKWGVIQHITDAGMSLTPGALTNTEGVASGVWNAMPKTLDERAPVINLTRNIVIQGIDDQAWKDSRFGAHTMYMGLSSEIKIDGVEFRRMGQAGAIGRYPIHWHMLSYNQPDGPVLPSNGTYLGAASGHFLKNSSIHQSGQRAVVIHGTDGILVDSNVCYDITGHAIFLEDSAERNNVLTNNVVMKVRGVSAANRLLNHDTVDGVTGYWYSNPTNTLQGNWASDCAGPGIWNTWASPRCFGLCEEVAIVPETSPITLHDGNMAHSCRATGMITENPVLNNRGDAGPRRYDGPGPEFLISNQFMWKNTAGGYNNRINLGRYRGWIQADNAGQDFFGASTLTSSMDRITMVGESLNNATSRYQSTRKAAMASYHELLVAHDCVAVNYPTMPPPDYVTFGGNNNPTNSGSGFMNFGDLYIEGMFAFADFTGLKFINSGTGYRTRPPILDGQPMAYQGRFRNYTFAGAIRDASNLFRNGTDKSYIFDVPFLTYQAADLVDEPPTGPYQGLNGKRTTTSYSAITTASTSDYPNGFNGPFRVDRLNTSNAVVGTWEIGDGDEAVGWGFNYLRNASLARGGRYLVDMGFTPPSGRIHVRCTHMNDPLDDITVGFKFSGATAAKVFIAYDFWWNNNTNTQVPLPQHVSEGSTVVYNSTGMTSIADVAADTTGRKFWQDVANNTVWVKLKQLPAWPGAPVRNLTSGYYLVINTA